MRYFIRLAYSGASYHGWQIQPHNTSVQQTIEEAMQRIMRQPISLTAAGRTDAGVNASMMMAHFDAEPIADTALLLHKLNCILPQDIALQGLKQMHADAHARFDATARTYHYYVCTEKSPFLHPYSCRCHPTLDFDLMNQGAKHLIRKGDFTSFSKLHTDVKTNNCDLREAHWDLDPTTGLWCFTVTADRFLRNMVRAIVGTLVQVGMRKITPEEVVQIIESKSRAAAGESMPAHALFLHRITYPYPTP